MSNLLKANPLIVGGVGVALTTGIAVLSYKYLQLKSTKHRENVYESRKLLDEYLAFHYGEPEEMMPYPFGPKDSLDFPRKCADLCMKHFEKKDDIPCRALDIGCAVGRSTFEMTKTFDEVIGIDFSHSFINACNILKVKGKLPYSLLMEGSLEQEKNAIVSQDLDRTKTIFQQGDACNLSPNIGQFGCVLAANLICRLHTPKDFLNRLASLVAPGGILVITSPYTFLTEYTPKDKWIGAYTENGKTLTAFDGLKKILAPAFELVEDQNIPFLIRETARKNQWTVSHATVWRRKS